MPDQKFWDSLRERMKEEKEKCEAYDKLLPSLETIHLKFNRPDSPSKHAAESTEKCKLHPDGKVLFIYSYYRERWEYRDIKREGFNQYDESKNTGPKYVFWDEGTESDVWYINLD